MILFTNRNDTNIQWIHKNLLDTNFRGFLVTIYLEFQYAINYKFSIRVYANQISVKMQVFIYP